MRKEKFTKGPWEWYENISGDKIGISDAEGIDVLYVNHSEGVVVPREKDASLMVAAPDIYEALSDLVSSLECSDIDIFILREEIKVARAALAKARGES